MGTAISLGIVFSVLNNFAASRLSHIFSPSKASTILQTSAAISQFSEQQIIIRSIFAEGYILQMRIVIGFGVAQLPASLLMWQKQQIVVQVLVSR